MGTRARVGSQESSSSEQRGVGSAKLARPNLALRPERPIQRSVLDGFRNVLWFDWADSIEVSDGSGNFQDAIVGAGRETLLGHGAF